MGQRFLCGAYDHGNRIEKRFCVCSIGYDHHPEPVSARGSVLIILLRFHTMREQRKESTKPVQFRTAKRLPYNGADEFQLRVEPIGTTIDVAEFIARELAKQYPGWCIVVQSSFHDKRGNVTWNDQILIQT